MMRGRGSAVPRCGGGDGNDARQTRPRARSEDDSSTPPQLGHQILDAMHGFLTVKVMDGGFASQLSRHVGEIDGHPLWSARFLAENPEAVFRVHLEYLQAGASIILTNSYQASIPGFMEHLGLSEESSEALIELSATLARRAVDEYLATAAAGGALLARPLVAGSVGPYGAALHNGSEYRGEYVDTVSEEEMAAWHEPRIRALQRAGVDFLAIETLPALEEARAVIRLLAEKFPNLKAWVSFSCKDDQHISNGRLFHETAAECWKLAAPGQLLGVGVNCLPPRWVAPLLQSVHSRHPNIPLVTYPNSGETWEPVTGWSWQEKQVPLSDYVPDWIRNGARYIGGCCRTYEEDTASMVKAVKRCRTKLARTS
ncbi:hypothetical protein B566_EDAN013527 [Ephemera danica]|nr:hypothetical protein B566_EDAN013527 [Ephemera danica]